MKVDTIEIMDEDRVLRRVIFTDPNYIREDMTVTSFAFKLRKGEKGLSVDIEKLTTYEKSIVSIEKYRLFALKAKNIRSLGLHCNHIPIAGNDAHAEISGENLNRPKIYSQLAKQAVYVNFPSANRMS